jgi:hypothetical protein
MDGKILKYFSGRVFVAFSLILLGVPFYAQTVSAVIMWFCPKCFCGHKSRISPMTYHRVQCSHCRRRFKLGHILWPAGAGTDTRRPASDQALIDEELYPGNWKANHPANIDTTDTTTDS